MSRTILRNIAVIAALCAPATVLAGTYFENGYTLEASDMLDLGLITSDGAGQVEVYDFHTGEIGTLLGTENIHEGANTNVRVSTGLPVRRDVLVVVRVDGQVLAEKAFEVN